MMSAQQLLRSLCLTAAVVIAACGGEHHGDDADSAPAAPGMLTATPLSGGAHLTWTDNSSNEDHFMVLRLEVGVDSDYETRAMTTFDATQFHDAPVTSGSTYMYKVVAMNAAGETASNEVTFVAP